jgi:hypothetical protein
MTAAHHQKGHQAKFLASQGSGIEVKGEIEKDRRRLSVLPYSDDQQH